MAFHGPLQTSPRNPGDKQLILNPNLCVIIISVGSSTPTAVTTTVSTTMKTELTTVPGESLFGYAACFTPLYVWPERDRYQIHHSLIPIRHILPISNSDIFQPELPMSDGDSRNLSQVSFLPKTSAGKIRVLPAQRSILVAQAMQLFAITSNKWSSAVLLNRSCEAEDWTVWSISAGLYILDLYSWLGSEIMIPVPFVSTNPRNLDWSYGGMQNMLPKQLTLVEMVVLRSHDQPKALSQETVEKQQAIFNMVENWHYLLCCRIFVLSASSILSNTQLKD